MKTKVLVSGQARDFIKALAPEPRQFLRAALRKLEQGGGDRKALEDELIGYSRLRVGRFRVIYRETVQGGQRTIQCLFVERRSIVYDLAASLALDELAGG